MDDAAATLISFIGVFAILWAMIRLFQAGRIRGTVWRIRWGRRTRRFVTTVIALITAAALVKSGAITLGGISDTAIDLAGTVLDAFFQ